MATPSARGTARSKANREEASVPKIIGAAPNTPATGSHTDVHRKVPPKRRIAGQALTTSSPTRASSSRGSKSAKPVSVPRYSRSPTFVPRSAWPRGAGAGAGAGGATTGSIGTVVMGRNVSSLCHETVTPGQKQHPPQVHTTVRGAAAVGLEGYRAAVVQTGLPPAEIVFSRASIHGRSCLGSGA